jgi:predicted Rossmann-fold nucleotide-binding protein
VATGLGHGRNLVIINTACALIAISGRYGTLSEIAFAIQSGKPVFGLGTWDIEGVVKCENPREAVEKALKACEI